MSKIRGPTAGRARRFEAARGRSSMLVNRLPFVVVLGRLQPVRPGDRLRGFVRLEASVQGAFTGRQRDVALALVTQHQVVMGFEILGIDRQGPPETGDRV